MSTVGVTVEGRTEGVTTEGLSTEGEKTVVGTVDFGRVGIEVELKDPSGFEDGNDSLIFENTFDIFFGFFGEANGVRLTNFQNVS